MEKGDAQKIVAGEERGQGLRRYKYDTQFTELCCYSAMEDVMKYVGEEPVRKYLYREMITSYRGVVVKGGLIPNSLQFDLFGAFRCLTST